MSDTPELARPSHASPAPARGASPRSEPSSALLPRRILIACAEPFLGEAIERVLRHHGETLAPAGMDVHRVHDGVSCLQQVEMLRPDVVLLSSQLDRMSASEILQAWQLGHPSEPLAAIVLSAVHGHDVPPGMSGAAVLRLPFDNDDLVGLVGRALAA